MDKDLLEVHENDPAWAEVIRLYSGLFDTQDEREGFILNLAEINVLLAAECETSSAKEENNLERYILEQSHNKYLKEKNEESITNHCLTLLNFDNYSELCRVIIDLNNIKLFQNKKNATKRIIDKIVQNYRGGILNMLNQILDSTENIIEHFFNVLNYDELDFNKEKEVILEISNKLLSTNFDLSFFYSMEKKTNYLLFPKSFIINKVKEHFETDKVFQITVLWIKKYNIKDLFPDDYVLSKIIQTEYWEMAFDFIESSDSLNPQNVALNIINKALSKNAKINFIINLAIKYNVTKELSSDQLIEYSLRQNDIDSFERILDIFNINYSEIIEYAVRNFINARKPDACLYLINKYSLQSIFTLDYLIEKKGLMLHPGLLENISKIYLNNELDSHLIKLVDNYYNENKLGLAVKIIEQYNLWPKFSFDNFIQKAFVLKKWGLLAQWFSKYNLEEKYSINDIIHNALINNDIHIAYQVANEYNLNFDDFYKISVGKIVNCSVRKIVKSRVFVKIEFKNRPASIYIGELGNKRIDDILDFEYNGEKLHRGQKLTAKVISIDEQSRINLSLRQVKKY